MDVTDNLDEFDLLDDFSNIPTEEFIRLDAVIASQYASRPLNKPSADGPSVVIKLEHDGNSNTSASSNPHSNASSAESDEKPSKPLSPLQRFRKNNILYVTDLASPAWCEVQFEYGLHGKRFIQLDRRPKSFVSRDGKEIKSEMVVAKKNEQIVRRGASVHKKLEREIRPEEVMVKVTANEERWALRIINMLDCIDSLLEMGRAREMPVFGFIRNQIVLGVMDEVVRLPRKVPSTVSEIKRPSVSLPETPRKTKRSRIAPVAEPSSSSASQTEIALFFGQSPLFGKSRTKTLPASTYTLRLIDTKTRQSFSVPSDDDALPARLQLMIYRRLLRELLHPSFDFSSLWERLDLDAERVFSDTFLQEAQLDSSLQVKCLDDLCSLWRNMVSLLDVDDVDETLQIVYRTRPRAGGDRSPGGVSSSQTRSREEEDLTKAIEASLRDVGQNVSWEEAEYLSKGIIERKENSTVDSRETDIIPTKRLADNTQVINAKPEQPVSRQATDDEASESDIDLEILQVGVEIVGTKRFRANDILLDEWLRDILLWWNGDRRPRGVSLHQTKRCNTCEYRMDCEWREAKAKKMARHVQRHRQARDSDSSVT